MYRGKLVHYQLICDDAAKYLNPPVTLASSGVIVAHLIPTLYFLIALAQSTVTTKDKLLHVYSKQSL